MLMIVKTFNFTLKEVLVRGKYFLITSFSCNEMKIEVEKFIFSNNKLIEKMDKDEINGGTGHDIIKVGNGKVDSNELLTLEQANIIMAA